MCRYHSCLQSGRLRCWAQLTDRYVYFPHQLNPPLSTPNTFPLVNIPPTLPRISVSQPHNQYTTTSYYLVSEEARYINYFLIHWDEIIFNPNSPCLPTISATCSELGTGTHSVMFWDFLDLSSSLSWLRLLPWPMLKWSERQDCWSRSPGIPLLKEQRLASSMASLTALSLWSMWSVEGIRSKLKFDW